MRTLLGLCMLTMAGSALAAPRFATDVAPILRDNCMSCHREDDDGGDLRVETFALLMKGGEAGKPIVPGRAGDSLLVKKIEGSDEPKMPPKKSLAPTEIAVIRAWIEAGAAGPTPAEAALLARNEVPVPVIAPRHDRPAPVHAVAFRPDGKALAIGRYREVVLVDPDGGGVLATLPGPSDLVRGLAWSPDGRWLAAGGGRPGRAGEAVVWSMPGKARTLTGHKDTVFDVAFSPDGKTLATSSYDRLVKLWDVETGKERRTLKEHTDAVFPVAFSPDGRWLASGAGDRTVKLWDVKSGRRLFSLTDSLEAVLTLAFDPTGRKLIAAGADKVVRTWQLGPEGGVQVQSITAHGDAILDLAFVGADRVVTASADRAVKLWDLRGGAEIRVISRDLDWAALSVSPDGKRLALGRHDGTVVIHDLDGARMTEVRLAVR